MTNTVPLTLKQVIELVNLAIEKGNYITAIDFLIQFASAAVNEVDRLQKELEKYENGNRN